jgi:hypothetical protein
MIRSLKKPAAIVLLATTAACTSLQPVKEPAGFLSQKNPRFVVITTEAQEMDGPLVVQRPQLQEGSLVGFLDGESVTLPMSRIRTVQAIQPDKKKTTLFLLGASVGVGIVTYMIVHTGSKIDNSAVCVPGGTRGDNPYCSGYDGIRR